MLPFDLHVLGLPPAFTLSQDQTLHLSFAARPEGLAKLLECSRRSRAPESLACISAFELTCCSVTNVCKMDGDPPARRPHKSPAHTVKDPRNRPQRRIPPPRTKVPERAAHHTALWKDVNTLKTTFLQGLLPSVPGDMRTPAGPRIVHMQHRVGKGVPQIFFTDLA